MRVTRLRRSFSLTMAFSSDIQTVIRASTSDFRSVFQLPMPLKTRSSLRTAGKLVSSTIGWTAASPACTMRSMTASRSACLESK